MEKIILYPQAVNAKPRIINIETTDILSQGLRL
jgi:hypothetical protein